MDYDPRIKLCSFDESSTYRQDYRRFYPDHRQYYSWPKDRIEPKSKPSSEFIQTDPATFIPWKKGQHIPFHLQIKPRPITDTCPYTPFILPEKPIDKGKEEAIKTRPRRYMSPAVSIDDVPDPEMRKLLIRGLYTTDWNRAAKEAAQPETKRIIPNYTVELKNDPMKLKTNLFNPLPPGWRPKGKPWDDHQKRACVDSTAMFWLKKDPPIKCGACVNPYKGVVPQEKKDEIAHLIKQDNLRLAHDIAKPDYAGYKPRLSAGVPMSKVDLPVTHPLMSASQAITQRYADDKRNS